MKGAVRLAFGIVMTVLTITAVAQPASAHDWHSGLALKWYTPGLGLWLYQPPWPRHGYGPPATYYDPPRRWHAPPRPHHRFKRWPGPSPRWHRRHFRPWHKPWPHRWRRFRHY